MFKNMKPLPKMILIGLVVGGAVFGYSKFVPKSVELAQAEATQTEAVAERADLKPVQEPLAQVSQPAPSAPTQTIPQPVNSPTSQSAGLDALLNLGTKK